MSAPDYRYLRNEFDFAANRRNPRGLDFRGMDAVRAVTPKIDKTSLREHFENDGTMKAVPYQDYLYEHRQTLRKL